MVSPLDLNPAIRVQISVEPELLIKSRSENTQNTRKIERKENRVGGLTSNKKGYRIADQIHMTKFTIFSRRILGLICFPNSTSRGRLLLDTNLNLSRRRGGEWLRRWTANLLGSARVGSNLIFVAPPHWFYGVMVSTLDFESSDPSSNLGRTWSIDQISECFHTNRIKGTLVWIWLTLWGHVELWGHFFVPTIIFTFIRVFIFFKREWNLIENCPHNSCILKHYICDFSRIFHCGDKFTLGVT